MTLVEQTRIVKERQESYTAQRDKREMELSLVAELRCEGKSARDIAAAMNCSLSKVAGLMKIVRARWQKHMARHARRHLAELLQRSLHAEKVAWRAWEKSTQQKKRYRARTKKPGPMRPDGTLAPEETVTEADTEDQCGDPRYLAIVHKEREFRAKLLGLLTDPGERANNGRGDPVPMRIVFEVPGDGINPTRVIDAVQPGPVTDTIATPTPEQTPLAPESPPVIEYDIYDSDHA